LYLAELSAGHAAYVHDNMATQFVHMTTQGDHWREYRSKGTHKVITGGIIVPRGLALSANVLCMSKGKCNKVDLCHL
jgi:hypothetical protein